MADTNDTFKLSGIVTVEPSPFIDGDAVSTRLPVYQEFEVANKVTTRYKLSADGPQVVSLGGLTSAAVVVIDSDQPLVATLTSTAGVVQTIPVDPFAVIIAKSVPYTAISLTRPLGVVADVRVVLAQAT